MIDLYNLQIGFRAAIYRLYRYSTPVGALDMLHNEPLYACAAGKCDIFRGLEEGALLLIQSWKWWRSPTLCREPSWPHLCLDLRHEPPPTLQNDVKLKTCYLLHKDCRTHESCKSNLGHAMAFLAHLQLQDISGDLARFDYSIFDTAKYKANTSEVDFMNGQRRKTGQKGM